MLLMIVPAWMANATGGNSNSMHEFLEKTYKKLLDKKL